MFLLATKVRPPKMESSVLMAKHKRKMDGKTFSWLCKLTCFQTSFLQTKSITDHSIPASQYNCNVMPSNLSTTFT